MLGEIGNTGASGAPHLHFQVSDGPHPLASEGVAFAFRSFRVPGTVTNLDEFLAGAPERPLPARSPV
jgi:murein DD-endopeptidase MepM/ murein hydrolase activator NlpD